MLSAARDTGDPVPHLEELFEVPGRKGYPPDLYTGQQGVKPTGPDWEPLGSED